MKNKFLPLLLCGLFLGGSFTFTSCGGDNQIHVCAPDGAPALALGKLLSEDSADDGIEYTVTTSNLITTFVTGRGSQADVCILPVNAASILPDFAETYQMIGLATHGNLYFLSAYDTQYTRDNIGDLKGKKIGVVNFNNVPGLALRATFADLGVMYVTDESAFTPDNVYLYQVNPIQVKPTGTADLYLCPEPKVSDKLQEFAADGFAVVGDLQDLYGGEIGYPQAAVVAKKSFIEGNPEKFAEIINGLTQCESYLSTASIAEICMAVASHREKNMTADFTQDTLTRECIARSNVRFERSADCYQRVNAFLQKLSQIDGTKANVVDESFYYFED